MKMKVSIDTSGFEKRIKELQRKANAPAGERQVQLSELFPPHFMAVNTDFSSLQAMVDASPVAIIDNDAAAQAFASPEWSHFVKSRSRYDSWEELRDAAIADYYRRELGLDK